MEQIDFEYTLDRKGRYGEYVAYISIEETRKQLIELYKITKFFGIKFEKYIPNNLTIESHDDVHAAITKMITEYELPRYLREKAEQADTQLHIDFEAEIAKRNPKLKEHPKVIEPQQVQKPAHMELTKISDWQGETYWLNQNGKRVNPNSLHNLKQYQNK